MRNIFSLTKFAPKWLKIASGFPPQIIAFPNTAEMWPCFCKEMQKVWRIKLDPPKIWGLIRNGNRSWWKIAGYQIFSHLKEIANMLKQKIPSETDVAPKAI